MKSQIGVSVSVDFEVTWRMPEGWGLEQNEHRETYCLSDFHHIKSLIPFKDVISESVRELTIVYDDEPLEITIKRIDK